MKVMEKQQTFASAAWNQKGKVTRRERFLAEMDAVIPWPRLLELIAWRYQAGKTGRQRHDLERAPKSGLLVVGTQTSSPRCWNQATLGKAAFDMLELARFGRAWLSGLARPVRVG